ncbi:MAG: MerR family transcriptional regulator [Luteitalea sp.]|nr:MerR family transcriptional regulator [Luteitalea sp.]
MTGLTIDTLRAWERRHGGVKPSRDRRGRLYTDADVARLRLLRDAVAIGHSIGRIARLDDAALQQLATTNPSSAAPPVAPLHGAVSAAAIASAIEGFDLRRVEVQLARAAALLSPTELLRDVIVPALREVGEHWHTRPLGIAQEHLLSGAVRNLLGSLIRVHARPDATGRLLFATPSGERHEFGALGGALVASSSGLGAIYLGPDIPAADIVEMATVTKSDVVALGVTLREDGYDNRARAEVQAIATRLPRHVELWLGGPAAIDASPAIQARAITIGDYDALAAELTRLGGRF